MRVQQGGTSELGRPGRRLRGRFLFGNAAGKGVAMKQKPDGEQPFAAPLTRRTFLAGGSAGLATTALGSISVAQTAAPQKRAPVNDPGQNNLPLEKENPSSNDPLPTDHGDTGPIWYSFNLAHRREEYGGWTRQVTQRELPPSKDIAGVNMRLAAGSFRELHWHTAAEWAIMLYGNARISVLNPDGSVFLDDVSRGDLWYFPAGYPHSIQGLGPGGCEFLLVFDQGLFSEENTFLLSEWLAHTSPGILKKNFNLDPRALAKLPQNELFIFPSAVPGSLSGDKASVGGS